MKANQFYQAIREQSGIKDPDQVLSAKLSGSLDLNKKDYKTEDVLAAIDVLSNPTKGLPSSGSMERRGDSQVTGSQGRTARNYQELIMGAMEAMALDNDTVAGHLLRQNAEEGDALGREAATVRTLAMSRGYRDEVKTHAIALLKRTRANVSRVEGYTQNPSGLSDRQQSELLDEELGKL